MDQAAKRPEPPQPRKHHILPAFYLAGFTATGTVRGRLHVFDYATGKAYLSTPRRACRETDFYRVEEPGVDPNYIEKLLAWHEGVVAPHVQGIARTSKVKDPRTVGEALAFAASLVVRNRQARDQLGRALAAGVAMKLRRGEVSRDQWEQLRAAELRNGATLEEVPDYDALDRLRNAEWFPRAPSVLTVGLIPQLQDSIMKTLQRRDWELHVTDPEESGGFICSDSPVAWGDLHEFLRGRRQNLESVDIEITFPVARNAALVSHPGARNGTLTATDRIVGHVNARTLQMSQGLIFHPHDDFLWRRTSGELGKGSDYMSYVMDARRRGIFQP